MDIFSSGTMRSNSLGSVRLLIERYAVGESQGEKGSWRSLVWCNVLEKESFKDFGLPAEELYWLIWCSE